MRQPWYLTYTFTPPSNEFLMWNSCLVNFYLRQNASFWEQVKEITKDISRCVVYFRNIKRSEITLFPSTMVTISILLLLRWKEDEAKKSIEKSRGNFIICVNAVSISDAPLKAKWQWPLMWNEIINFDEKIWREELFFRWWNTTWWKLYHVEEDIHV